MTEISQRYPLPSSLDAARALGQQIAHALLLQGSPQCVVGGTEMHRGVVAALSEAAHGAGVELVMLDEVPAAALSFALHSLGYSAGCFIGAEHIVVTTTGGAVQAPKSELNPITQIDIQSTYTQSIVDDCGPLPQPIHVRLVSEDATTARWGQEVLRGLGAECQIAAHHTDSGLPSDDLSLAELTLILGDYGQHLEAVLPSGDHLSGDRLLAAVATELMCYRRTPVICDLGCSGAVVNHLRSLGVQVHFAALSDIAKVQAQTGSMLAGSSEGQLFFRDRHQGFADAIYSAARLCHLLPALSQADARIPRYPSFTKQAQSTAAVDFTSLSAPYVEAQCEDGVRLHCAEGWILVRQMNSDLLQLKAECGGSIDGLMALKQRATSELQLSQLSQLELRVPDQS